MLASPSSLRIVLLGALVLAALAAPAPARAALAGEPEVVARGLEFPWEVVPLPDGRILVTERPGRVRAIGADGGMQAAPVYAEPGTKFLGLALHPAYACNRLLFLYVSSWPAGGNRIVRLRDDGARLVEPRVVFSGIDSDGIHDGGRMKFGPDGKLYVTTGDVHDPARPQDLDALEGKILRLEADGSPPSDNPFNAPGERRARRFVWSLGHRHPQGIDWDAGGRMWQTEHGPTGEAHAGGRYSRDEINRIDRGANYGWPVIMGDESAPGMRSPVRQSGDSNTWAPAGAAFGPDGVLYAPELAGEGLLAVEVSGDAVTGVRELYPGTFGRMRTAVATERHLYLTTSNLTSDEKVVRVPFDRARPVPGAPACPAAGGGSGAAAGHARYAPRAALVRVLRRARVRLRREGLRRLGRRGHLTLSAEGLPAGRVSVRLDSRARRARARTLAAGSRRLDWRPARVRARVTPRGRAMLGRARSMRIRVRAAFRAADGSRAARSTALRVQR